MFFETTQAKEEVQFSRGHAQEPQPLSQFCSLVSNNGDRNVKVEVEFSDGRKFQLSAEFLRVHSPSVYSKVRSIGGEKVHRYPGGDIWSTTCWYNVTMSAEPVGNYGVKIIFDDLHKTGIYTWDYFHRLGSNKFSLMRSYIKTLKKHSLSRDPSRRK
ncbi:hypothetical protein J5N97_020337 [Dioscorea zingiberensis]|uniref:Gamma-butyrobetaine hydroxylase-like N-terminal domain-containing protein n=1 Tax=Dioscorea zingiberensis TaxID=325984 RepID=A0A9D5HDQ3_9LILI|nr:hypothetical protein J5N97_020337 [Dioscorea zingiberensis]